MSKYYTPTIEEFHVGFEYETMELGSRTKYNPTTLNEWDDLAGDYDGITLLYEIARGKQSVRVKYLDREDIESLGGEYQGLFDDRIGYEGNHRYLINDFLLSVTPYHNDVDYGGIYIERDGDIYFEGKLKNKSELKRLLKQLDI